ncbi:phosphoribosylformylglycinamidine cyclo-ligase [Tepidibacillus fermentans]|uniref:Phosphoribosylformylglycinamidine cyclo-ligase n=1 Tax=Tepidibacillus fermentans TaxID=1281767 RepID=A0A4V2USA3_9BACI|nr:phosphoribosylformylglycinamidine cyclo-ligase [Tepidibacillus fermentans]TCS80612.1 phosphoribosylformylglycinamidine cyclo-ligase [Tepidibacillus fermentans]
MRDLYKEAGVDIQAGNETVRRISNHVRKTFRKEVRTDLGGFGGLFALPIDKYRRPILVSGTDGVGTKLKIAYEMNRHNTIGIDAVAMCVNDILVYGAEPLFFLDYLATGKLLPEQAEQVVSGIVEGCLQANCSLIGGETAEMPGIYQNSEYDVAGFVVGVVEEDQIIDGSSIKHGDVLIGLASNGLHSNGFSLVRYLLFEKHHYRLTDLIEELGNQQLGVELLKPTRIYVKPILKMLEEVSIKGMVHITGGGFIENIPRVIPKGLQANIQLGSWDVPAIFSFLQRLGDLRQEELYRTFNMGIGFILIVSKEEQEKVIQLAGMFGEKAYVIGEIMEGNQGVNLLGEKQ